MAMSFMSILCIARLLFPPIGLGSAGADEFYGAFTLPVFSSEFTLRCLSWPILSTPKYGLKSTFNFNFLGRMS